MKGVCVMACLTIMPISRKIRGAEGGPSMCHFRTYLAYNVRQYLAYSSSMDEVARLSEVVQKSALDRDGLHKRGSYRARIDFVDFASFT